MRNRDLAEAALRASTPVFTPRRPQCDHLFVDGDEVSGVLDWSEAGQGDAMFDLAIRRSDTQNTSSTSSQDTEPVSTSTWSARAGPCEASRAIRWLIDHGFGPFSSGMRGRRAPISEVRSRTLPTRATVSETGPLRKPHSSRVDG
ncbi:MAG TPA: phosphotransferase [Ornithinibacter sp.]|nr:phosphotransferase [Ornithinibacter sp.]